MFALVVMIITIAISVLQLLHHWNLTDGLVPGITHLWSACPVDADALRRRIQFTALKSDQRDALQPCWNEDKPCWPEDAPARLLHHQERQRRAAEGASTQVGAALEGWCAQLLAAVQHAWASFPALAALCLGVCVVYAAHVGKLMRVLPKAAEGHFRAIFGAMEAAHREIESKSSQTSQHLIGGARDAVEGQESRSLEVVMDILNEMNEGLTMQQWYEQEKLNIMMEDDLRASRTSSRYSRAATDVNKVVRDLNRFGSKRDKRLSKLKESKHKAETSFQKCYALLGDLEGVRTLCGGGGDDEAFDKRFPRVR